MQSEFVLEMEGISKEYFGNPVLKDVSIRVRPGEILALVGENGSGKSTVIKLLCGLYQPEEGEILADGLEADCRRQVELPEGAVRVAARSGMLLGKTGAGEGAAS